MTFRETAQRAVITTGVVAAVAVAILTTPEVTTQVAAGVVSAAASSIALLALSRTRWLRSAPPAQLGLRIWLTAGCSALLVWAFFWIPLVAKHAAVRSNNRATLDAAVPFCLCLEAHWRRASEHERWAGR